MKVNVINAKNFQASQNSYNVYIGRDTSHTRAQMMAKRHSKHIIMDDMSILGNPFQINQTSSREEVIKKYKDYFVRHLISSGEFKENIKKLINVFEHGTADEMNLVCWCAPLPCHGDVIKEFLESGLKV